MFSKTAEHYDRIYGAFKNYSEESTKIATLIKEIHPRAQTVLDVACGTGEHARQLTERFGYVVDGIDLDANLIALAALKNRGRKFSVADMIDFNLDKKFDVISCLFSSIGYVRTIENVERTLTQFKQHLAKDGVVIVEPWYAPDSWTEGKVFLKTYEDSDLKVARVSHAKRDGDLSVLDFEYLIGTVSGISHEVERHELGLFSIDTMKACFAHAGFTVAYDPVGLTDRGLYVGRLR
jgi:ubiquinone/menaquinone biosynthesis C-methylase UbiE